VHNSELTDRMADGTLSRRRLSQLLATVGLAAVAIPVVGRRLHAEEQAVYFTWSVYNDPDFFPDYVKKHGANPDVGGVSERAAGYS
jgi:spermidine/putrescine-binding protein